MTDTALTAPAADHDRLSLQEGIRTALAAALAYWITGLLGLPGGYWAAISAIVVMQSEVGANSPGLSRPPRRNRHGGGGWLADLADLA
jgi:uncharacterized membrane protein YccC